MLSSVTRGTEADKAPLTPGCTRSRRDSDARTGRFVPLNYANVAIGQTTQLQEYCYWGRILVLHGHSRDIWLVAVQR
jgi:hypothetical protein